MESSGTAGTVKQWALAIAAVVCVIALLPVGWISWRHAPEWADRVDFILMHGNRLMLEASLTMLESKKASHETYLRAQELQATISTATGTLDEATLALAQLRATIAEIGTAATSTTDAVKGSLAHLDSVSDQLTIAVKATNETLNGPAVKTAIANLAAATGELDKTAQASTKATQEAAGAIGDVHLITSHYKEEVLAPVSWGKKLNNWLLEFSAALGAKLVP